MSTCLCKGGVGPTKVLCAVNVKPVWGGCIEDIEDKQIKQRLQSQQVCIIPFDLSYIKI